MTRSGLTIETSPRGIDRLIVHIDRGDHDAGLALLRRVLPALRELDRRTRRAGPIEPHVTDQRIGPLPGEPYPTTRPDTSAEGGNAT